MARAKLCGVLTDVRGSFVDDNKINASGKHGIRINPDGTHSLVQYSKRDLNMCPYSENETMQKQLFKSAAGLTKVALSSPAKKAQWQERFKEDKDGCNTLRGYVMKQAFAGHVSTTGDYE